MEGLIRTIGTIIFLSIGTLQFFATIAGIQDWWGWHWSISGIVAFFVAYIPILGTITGFMGAVDGWGWSYLNSGLLFFGVPALAIIACFATVLWEKLIIKKTN